VTDLDTYRAQVASLAPDRIIGSILWFSITGTVDRADGRRTMLPVRVQHDVLTQWFTELDLDERFLPPKIKKIDAFRTATSNVKGTRYPLNEYQEAEFLVTEIDANPEYVLRHIIREVRDKNAKHSTYAHVATLKFFRGARTSAGKRHSMEHYKATINHTLVEVGLDGKKTGNTYPLDAVDRMQVENLLANIEVAYTDLAANLHAQAIRAVIRNYLVHLNAIAVKPSGGVYFVHNSRQSTLNNLQELVKRIGQGCSFHQIPLPDTTEQREMLTEAFEAEVEDDCRLLQKEIAEVNDKARTKGGKITAAKYADLSARYADIVQRSEEYTRVLGLAQERAAIALENSLDLVMDLATRIDVKGGKS